MTVLLKIGADFGDNDRNPKVVQETSTMNVKQQEKAVADDEFLARELNELTVKEREELLEELHGVSQMEPDTEELVSLSLEKLRPEVENSPQRKRRALERAVFLKPTLLQDKAFLRMFLRADHIDSTFQAQRCVC